MLGAHFGTSELQTKQRNWEARLTSLCAINLYLVIVIPKFTNIIIVHHSATILYIGCAINPAYLTRITDAFSSYLEAKKLRN